MTSRIWIAAAVFVGTAAVQAAEPAGPADVQTAPVKVEWTFSVDGGKTFAATPHEPVIPGKPLKVTARGRFHVDSPAAVAALFLKFTGEGGILSTADKAQTGDKENLNGALLENTVVKVNGKTPAGPLSRMLYDWMPLSPDVLAAGENVIEVSGTLANYTAARPPVTSLALAAAPPQTPKLLYGPMLGAFGDDYFSVTCRTNVAAEVSLTTEVIVRNRDMEDIFPTASSPRGFYHRLRVPLSKGARLLTYSLAVTVPGENGASLQETFGPFKVKAPAMPGWTLKFITVGNTHCTGGTPGGVGPKLSAAMLSHRPDLFVHAGQMVEFAWTDREWENVFYGSFRPVLSTVPVLLAPNEGDHSGFAEQAIYTPAPEGRMTRWTQVLGPVRLIGIDALHDWSANGENARWLESVLKDAHEKYIFAFDHYPGYSTGRMSRPPISGPMLDCRAVIHPLLAKYRATAVIGACDYHYERHEPPADKGVTQFVVGGGGCKVYRISGRAVRDNPYSKVFGYTFSFAVFDAQADRCLLRTYDFEGNAIDERVFFPRPGSN